jgi:hypothetical protein
MIELLDLDDIAKLYRVSRRHARDVLVKQPGFPTQAPGTSSKIPLWSAAKIQAYIADDFAKIPQDGLEPA